MNAPVTLPPGVHLRRAERTDAAAIHRLIWRERLNPLSLDWRRFTLAVDAQGRMLACAQIKPHGGGTRELASLAVLPAWRGQGLAGALIRHLQAQAGPPLYLTCRAALVPFYARHGFRAPAEDDLPAYFRRLRRAADWLFRLAGRRSSMRILRWYGRQF